jgi:hypothetical protein
MKFRSSCVDGVNDAKAIFFGSEAVSVESKSELTVTSYGVMKLHATETADDALAIAAAVVLYDEAAEETWHLVWTLAVTLKDAIGVAATANRLYDKAAAITAETNLIVIRLLFLLYRRVLEKAKDLESNVLILDKRRTKPVPRGYRGSAPVSLTQNAGKN